jgi:hypothetical protein
MAIWEDLFPEGGTAGLIGLGAIVAAPVVLPAVGAVVRPLIDKRTHLGRICAD